MKVSRTRRKHRSTSSTNSAFLVGKRRNRYGWLMPAFRATSSVEVPASPCTANSATAASRTSSRRSAAGILCLVSVMGTKLVMTHYFVKSPAETGWRARIDHLNGGPTTLTSDRIAERKAAYGTRHRCRRPGSRLHPPLAVGGAGPALRPARRAGRGAVLLPQGQHPGLHRRGVRLPRQP